MRNPVSRMSRRSRVAIISLVVLFLLFTVFDRIVGVWTDYLWFGELLGLFPGISAQSHWQDWMLFHNSTPFHQQDPQFHVDISYYVFRYPWWRYLLGVGFTTVVFAVIGSLALHYLFGGVRLQGA